MARTKIKWLPYEEAKKLVHPLKIPNYKEWLKHVKVSKIPPGIPKNPQITYGKDYVSDSDFLGTTQKNYLPYYQAKYFIRTLQLKSFHEYKNWYSKHRPKNLPSCPDYVYNEWESWGEFLGSGQIHTHSRVWRPYQEAKKFVHPLKLIDRDDWFKWCSRGQRPKDIPIKPEEVYEEWESWGAWLGRGVVNQIKAQQQNTTVVYIIHEQNTPANIFTIGTEQNGKGAVIDRQQKELFQIIKIYKLDKDIDVQHIKFLISRNGSEWWDGHSNNQYLIRNIHQLIWDIYNQNEDNMLTYSLLK